MFWGHASVIQVPLKCTGNAPHVKRPELGVFFLSEVVERDAFLAPPLPATPQISQYVCMWHGSVFQNMTGSTLNKLAKQLSTKRSKLQSVKRFTTF